ncbi:MAG: hypothetical protein WKG06_30400 [Segetibacter sp.]
MGAKKCNLKFVYCDKEDDFEKYSVSPSAPAVTYLTLGSVVVLSNGAIDLDIIAHEISHAEFYDIWVLISLLLKYQVGLNMD